MSKKPNLIFFGLDSMRRDHMSTYGYERLTTPHIDKYAKGGAVFSQCFSANIPTTPGYGSMLTGMDCFGTNIVALRHQGDFAEGVPTLAEVLSSEGYNTSCVGFTGNPASRGFDTYLNFEGWGAYDEGRAHKAEHLNDVAIPELHRLVEDDKPFFLFMRHMDPHSPYLPPAPFERIFYAGDEYDKDNTSLEECYDFKPFADYFKSWFPPDCTDAEYVNAQYDGAVAYMDAAIQMVLTEIKTLALEEDTLVIFVSDHGETLDEHDCYYDHHSLYEPTLMVPLVFRMPGTVPAEGRFDDTCTLKDVMPTILDVLGIDIKKFNFDGRSLYSRMLGDKLEAEPEFYITECTWMRKHGWRTPQYKLICALEPDLHWKPAIELYDLCRDPLELNNIADEAPEIVEALTIRMNAHIALREQQTGRTNPMYTNLDWHGIQGHGPFKTAQEAYDSMYIGGASQAKDLQEDTDK